MERLNHQPAVNSDDRRYDRVVGNTLIAKKTSYQAFMLPLETALSDLVIQSEVQLPAGLKDLQAKKSAFRKFAKKPATKRLTKVPAPKNSKSMTSLLLKRFPARLNYGTPALIGFDSNAR